MSNKPILYMHTFSPPSRAVLMTGAALGIEFECKVVNLLEFAHLEPKFVKLNPQHTIPFLDDNGVLIADSHAICAYLVGKYGKDDSLYPKDLAKRAQVDSRLHFDSGHLFARLRFLYAPILYCKSSEMPEDRIQNIQTAWDILERFLSETPYVCGNDLTIADLCLVATASSLTDIVPLDPVKHSKIKQWIDRLSQLPYYEEVNAIGAKGLQAAIRKLLKKNAESK
ncbi:glutathione S-transferase 1-like [Sitodiplosis mosellana]|uniref:glutathione S-transferase 1-like n=1 Tax=Sitodiplosis mosellana TaxID=263140 RepID=UPI002444743A|nr:glutathione S-transferase 1-like [Sitodiplosis mosellana]XP_055307098.1 glutathione S-transferase 1-like [Sitodiplosis mosellana]XP_055307099.1 glutathione S-transferase 1-like [Sitodiplosis mosellana]XP_055307100.1 glutathione S-transferase 1-like [Sitodiplosis mosellana]